MVPSPTFVAASSAAAAALCIVTALLAFTKQDLGANGTTVLLPRVCTPYESAHRGDGRELWVRLLPHGKSSINNKPFALRTIPSEIATAMSARQERVVFLAGSAEMAYGEVASEAATLHNAYPDIYVALVTVSQVKAAGPFPCIWLSSELISNSQ